MVVESDFAGGAMQDSGVRMGPIERLLSVALAKKRSTVVGGARGEE